jgi:hypothetical protein
MSILARREWYVAALVLILGAIAARLLAMHHAKCGMMAMARASAFPADRVPLREVAYWHVRRSGIRVLTASLPPARVNRIFRCSLP